jgi:HSP20 family protein
MFSERYYGQFERRIPVEDVDEGKVAASFKNGVLTVTLPKSPRAQEKVKRIAINSK